MRWWESYTNDSVPVNSMTRTVPQFSWVLSYFWRSKLIQYKIMYHTDPNTGLFRKNLFAEHWDMEKSLHNGLQQTATHIWNHRDVRELSLFDGHCCSVPVYGCVAMKHLRWFRLYDGFIYHEQPAGRLLASSQDPHSCRRYFFHVYFVSQSEKRAGPQRRNTRKHNRHVGTHDKKRRKDERNDNAAHCRRATRDGSWNLNILCISCNRGCTAEQQTDFLSFS